MVVFSNGVGPNFEDLAGSRVMKNKRTAVLIFIQMVFWNGLLVGILGHGQGLTGYLMIIVGLGLFQNPLVAGVPRPPSASGFYEKKRVLFHGKTVRDTLCKAEEEIEDLGSALRPFYFPGGITAEDDEVLEGAVAKRLEASKKIK